MVSHEVKGLLIQDLTRTLPQLVVVGKQLKSKRAYEVRSQVYI